MHEIERDLEELGGGVEFDRLAMRAVRAELGAEVRAAGRVFGTRVWKGIGVVV